MPCEAEKVVLCGATSSQAGVALAGEGSGAEDHWLSAAGWVARTWIDVSAIRERLIEASRWVVESMSIDYANDLGICGPVWEQQAEFAGWALRQRGLHGNALYRTQESKGVLAGPGATYHVDKGFGVPCGLFVVTSVLGGGVLHFPHLDLKLSLEPGETVVFDGLQVHGVLPAGGGIVGAQPFVVVSSEVLVSREGARELGLVASVRPEGSADLDSAWVEPATGRLLAGGQDD